MKLDPAAGDREPEPAPPCDLVGPGRPVEGVEQALLVGPVDARPAVRDLDRDGVPPPSLALTVIRSSPPYFTALPT